jgi:hypothetical protein
MPVNDSSNIGQPNAIAFELMIGMEALKDPE